MLTRNLFYSVTKKAIFTLCLPVIALSSTSAMSSETGTFTTLAYNVAGLPDLISSAPSERTQATKRISCYVNEFDIVNVQEDYNYHAALYDTCNDHPYRTNTTGGVGFGSGLNTMSRFNFTDLIRVTWEQCADTIECIGKKGFTLTRQRIREGVFIDVYNIHAGAMNSPEAQNVRRAQMMQLLGFISYHSAGNPVIITGDFNARWTRVEDNMDEFRLRGFKDAWIEVIRAGAYPAKGPSITCEKPQFTSPDCEVVDKALYRSNGQVDLTPLSYELRLDAVDNNGTQLSDHPPVVVQWQYTVADDLQLSDRVGGPHGISFNNATLLPDNPKISSLNIRAGKRLDQFGMTLASGQTFRHGGNGGSARNLNLYADEHVVEAELCRVKHNGRTRVGYARFTTTYNRELNGGRKTDYCRTFTAPAGWAIVGAHGRSGGEVDSLGFVYAPMKNAFYQPLQFSNFLNSRSGKCLDIKGGKANQGQNVQVYNCHSGDGQQWHYDAYTGLIRSRSEGGLYCLDNSGVFYSGANVIVAKCSGNVNQRFIVDNGSIRMRSVPALVVDDYIDQKNVGMWYQNGGSQQNWSTYNH